MIGAAKIEVALKDLINEAPLLLEKRKFIGRQFGGTATSKPRDDIELTLPLLGDQRITELLTLSTYSKYSSRAAASVIRSPVLTSKNQFQKK